MSAFERALEEALGLAGLDVHPALAAVPLIPVDTLRELRREIAADGLRVRMLVTPARQLVDGRARLVCLVALGVKLQRAQFNVWRSSAGNLERLWSGMAWGLNADRVAGRRPTRTDR